MCLIGYNQRIRLTVLICVSEEQEREGFDRQRHGENAYNARKLMQKCRTVLFLRFILIRHISSLPEHKERRPVPRRVR